MPHFTLGIHSKGVVIVHLKKLNAFTIYDLFIMQGVYLDILHGLASCAAIWCTLWCCVSSGPQISFYLDPQAVQAA